MVVHNCVYFLISSYFDKDANRMLMLRPEVSREANLKQQNHMLEAGYLEVANSDEGGTLERHPSNISHKL